MEFYKCCVCERDIDDIEGVCEECEHTHVKITCYECEQVVEYIHQEEFDQYPIEVQHMTTDLCFDCSERINRY